VVFAEAYGAAHLDPFAPMTVDTVVDIGSVSKQFTATAILLLAERGAIDLDAPLSTYLPDLPAWASQPTIAQLIHHQSGIPDYLDLLVDRGFTGPVGALRSRMPLLHWAMSSICASHPARRGSTRTRTTSCWARWSRQSPVRICPRF
jgi:CubicO group peptidase (beta-lactamase class C family)